MYRTLLVSCQRINLLLSRCIINVYWPCVEKVCVWTVERKPVTLITLWWYVSTTFPQFIRKKAHHQSIHLLLSSSTDWGILRAYMKASYMTAPRACSCLVKLITGWVQEFMWCVYCKLYWWSVIVLFNFFLRTVVHIFLGITRVISNFGGIRKLDILKQNSITSCRI